MCWEDQKIARKKYVAAKHNGDTTLTSEISLPPNIYRCGIVFKTNLPILGITDEWMAHIFVGDRSLESETLNIITRYDDRMMRIEDWGQAIQGPLYVTFTTTGAEFNWYVIEIALNFKNELDD